LTDDPTVTGTVTASLSISKLEAQVDGGAFQNITQALVGQQYLFDPSPLSAGPHQVTIRATDSGGQAADAVVTFQVNSPPVAHAGGDRAVTEGSTVAFDGSSSADSEGPIFSYHWTFDDGSSADGVTASHLYAQDGVYSASLTVTDTAGS